MRIRARDKDGIKQTYTYGFRWRLIYNDKGTWREPFRIRFKQTLTMLSIVWDRATIGPGGKKWLYIVVPGIVDVNEHMWEEPKWRL